MSPSSAGPREVITDKEAAVGTGKDINTPTKEASTTGANNKGVAILLFFHHHHHCQAASMTTSQDAKFLLEK